MAPDTRRIFRAADMVRQGAPYAPAHIVFAFLRFAVFAFPQKEPPAAPGKPTRRVVCISRNRLSSDARVSPGAGRWDQRPESALTS